MDPLVTGLINLGGLGAAVALLYKLHVQALSAFREEMKTERDRNDGNLARLFLKYDDLKTAVDAARCRAPQYGPNAPRG